MRVVEVVCFIGPWFIDSVPFARFQYNIKKREEVQEATQEEPNPLMRKKKTPEELAAEAEAEDEDEITSTYVYRCLVDNSVASHLLDNRTRKFHRFHLYSMINVIAKRSRNRLIVA